MLFSEIPNKICFKMELSMIGSYFMMISMLRKPLSAAKKSSVSIIGNLGLRSLWVHDEIRTYDDLDPDISSPST